MNDLDVLNDRPGTAAGTFAGTDCFDFHDINALLGRDPANLATGARTAAQLGFPAIGRGDRYQFDTAELITVRLSIDLLGDNRARLFSDGPRLLRSWPRPAILVLGPLGVDGAATFEDAVAKASALIEGPGDAVVYLQVAPAADEALTIVATDRARRGRPAR